MHNSEGFCNYKFRCVHWHAGAGAASTKQQRRQQLCVETFWLSQIPNFQTNSLISPISIDSDSRHSITLLHIPLGRISSRCFDPLSEETSVQGGMEQAMLTRPVIVQPKEEFQYEHVAWSMQSSIYCRHSDVGALAPWPGILHTPSFTDFFFRFFLFFLSLRL